MPVGIKQKKNVDTIVQKVQLSIDVKITEKINDLTLIRARIHCLILLDSVSFRKFHNHFVSL